MKPPARSGPDLASLFDEHQGRLLALTLRITGDFALAEDAFQQTFLMAHASAGSFRGEAAAGTWLYRIAAREAVRLRAGRLRRREQTNHADAGKADRDGGSNPGAGCSLEWRERTDRLLRALDELPEEQRLALVLLSARQIRAEEIGVMLGVSPGTVYTRAFRARVSLRERLGTLDADPR